jgi:hypothetical protein
MVEQITPAFVAHASLGRLRLRIPDRKGDAAYFARLEPALASCPGVARVEGRAATGSLLIFHAPAASPSEIAAYAERQGLFAVTDRPAEPPKTLLRQVGDGMSALDRSLTEATRGVIDLPSALFVALVGLAVRQAGQGNLLGPTSTLLWAALGLTGLKSGPK